MPQRHHSSDKPSQNQCGGFFRLPLPKFNPLQPKIKFLMRSHFRNYFRVYLATLLSCQEALSSALFFRVTLTDSPMYALGKDVLSNNGCRGSVWMFTQLMSKIIRAEVSSEPGVIANLVSQANVVVKDWTPMTTVLLREPIAAFDPQG